MNNRQMGYADAARLISNNRHEPGWLETFRAEVRERYDYWRREGDRDMMDYTEGEMAACGM